MGLAATERRSVSLKTRDKCIEKARKEVLFLDKWGRWAAASSFVFAIGYLGLGAGFIAILEWFMQLPGNPQQAQVGIWTGFAFGMVFGAITISMLYNGVHQFAEGIGYLRGKPESRLLVEYHDAITNLHFLNR